MARKLNESVQDSSGVGANLGMTEVGNLGLVGTQHNTGSMQELVDGGDGFTNPGATKPSDGIQTAGSRDLTTALNNDGAMWEVEQETKPGSPDDGFLKDMGGAGSDLGQNDKMKNTGSHMEPVSFKVAETVSAESWDRDVVANLMEGSDITMQEAFDGYARFTNMVCLEDFREVARAYYGDVVLSENDFVNLLNNNKEFVFTDRQDAQGTFWVPAPITEAPSMNPFRATKDILGGGDGSGSSSMGRPSATPGMDNNLGGPMGAMDDFDNGENLDDDFGDEVGAAAGGALGGAVAGAPGAAIGGAVGGKLGGAAMTAFHSDDEGGFEEDAGGMGTGGVGMGTPRGGVPAKDTPPGWENSMLFTDFPADDSAEYDYDDEGDNPLARDSGNIPEVPPSLYGKDGKVDFSDYPGERYTESIENGLDDEANADSNGYYTSDATKKGKGDIGDHVRGVETQESKNVKAKDGITKDHKGMNSGLGENDKVENKGGGWEKLSGGGSSMKENVAAMGRRAKASIQEAASSLSKPGRYKMSFDVSSPGVKPNRYLHLTEALVDLEELVQAYGVDGPRLKVNFHGKQGIVESALVRTGTIRRRDPIIAENRVVFRRKEVARDFADQVAGTGTKCIVSAHPWGATVNGSFNWSKACNAFQSIPAQVLR